MLREKTSEAAIRWSRRPPRSRGRQHDLDALATRVGPVLDAYLHSSDAATGPSGDR